MSILRLAILAVLLLLPTGLALSWVGAAEDRLEQASDEPSASTVAIAAASDEQYCTPALKKILRRVLQSCGLLGSGAEAGTTRGCQPLEAKNIATLSGDDFNALFVPMKDRGGIVQFDMGEADLDDDDTALVDRIFSDQRGASYFFVVARASPEGSVAKNRALSKQRSATVLKHLREKFKDPDLDREVGLLWLGEEFAQLDKEFCAWKRSGGSEACLPRDINRSAFITWIDCRL